MYHLVLKAFFSTAVAVRLAEKTTSTHSSLSALSIVSNNSCI
jgi:hypothetical protein